MLAAHAEAGKALGRCHVSVSMPSMLLDGMHAGASMPGAAVQSLLQWAGALLADTHSAPLGGPSHTA